MLIDEIAITIRGGHGGAGKVSFGRMFRSGPDGGNGGRGGDVYIRATSDLTALNRYSQNPHIKAEDGEPGGRNRVSGSRGKDEEILVPIGTTLTEVHTGELLEFTNTDQKVLVCKGGLGGRGNFELKSSRNRAPDFAQHGLPGEYKEFQAVLKFLAQYGLVGLPNAGKSSLLNELTNAHAQVGAYPFTTLEANLGVLHGKVIADIPGLIEGASTGKGLGIKFLKHIEKVEKILHCVAADSADVNADFETVSRELEIFDSRLAAKDRIIILTKIDLIDKKDVQYKSKQLSPHGYPVIPVSIHDWDSLKKLEKTL